MYRQIPQSRLIYPSNKSQQCQINKSIKSSPFLPYNGGKPVYNPNNPLKLNFNINFSETPFTYINMGSYNNKPTPKIQIKLKNVPYGIIFFVTTPSEWVNTNNSESTIILENSTLPNSVLIVKDVKNGVNGIMVTSDKTGIKGCTLN